MKDKIICIATPDARTYYKATPLAKEFLDKEHNIVNTTGTIPEGQVAEISVSSVTFKNFSNGVLHGKLEVVDLVNGNTTFTEEYNQGSLVHTTPSQKKADEHTQLSAVSIPAIDGTVLKVNKGTLSFYVNGQEVAEETLSSNGFSVDLLGKIPDGEVKELDENNKIKAIAHYKNNKRNGTLVRFDDDGEIILQEEYTDGVLQGNAKYISYLVGNTLITRCHYKNALLHGERTVTQKNGTLRERATYTDGKLQGERTLYYTNGSIESQEQFKDGKLNGPRILYFPSGEVWCREHFANGKLEGDRISYFINGKVFSEEFYSEGALNGTRRIYAQTGELLTNEEYHWGTLIHNTERGKHV